MYLQQLLITMVYQYITVVVMQQIPDFLVVQIPTKQQKVRILQDGLSVQATVVLFI